MFGKRTAEPGVPKPGDAAQVLVTTLVKAYDEPANTSVRNQGIELVLLAVEAGFVKTTYETDKSDPSINQVYQNNYWPELKAAIKEAKLRGWVDLDPNDEYVRLLPPGLDYGRGLLRTGWRDVFSFLVKIPKALYYLAAFLASVLAIGRILGFI